MSKIIAILLALALLGGAGLAAWGRAHGARPAAQAQSAEGTARHGSTMSTATVAGHAHPMAALSLLPPDMRDLPAETEEAYLFSLANPAVAQAIPCYCGCVGLGHVSSYDCYVAEAPAGGTLVYEPHALNCHVCVSITQDAMRLLDEGRPIADIRAAIDDAYAMYGPPTPLD